MSDNKALADRPDWMAEVCRQAAVTMEANGLGNRTEQLRNVADQLAALTSPQADKARGEVVAWIEPGHLREQGKLAARAGYGMPLVASTAPRDQTCIPLYTTPKPQECAHERSHAAPWRCAHCDYQFDMEGA